MYDVKIYLIKIHMLDFQYTIYVQKYVDYSMLDEISVNNIFSYLTNSVNEYPINTFSYVSDSFSIEVEW